MYWQSSIYTILILNMLKFSHIPVTDSILDTKWVSYAKGRLCDTIERIIHRWWDQELSIRESVKYWRFYSEAIELLFPWEDDEIDGSMSHFKMLENRQKLIELYISQWINNQKWINQALLQQWREAHEWWDSRVTIWDRYFYEISQNIHGDVALAQYPLVDKVQSDLFGKNWYTVGDVKGDIISCYQETLWLVAALLRWYILAWWDIWELERVLQELAGQGIKGVFATDSWTKEDSVKSYLWSIDRTQVHPKYLWFFILLHPPSQWYQTAYSSDLKEFEFWVVEKTDTGFLEKKILGIPSIDIPNILKELCILSWRSWSWPRMLISEYIKLKSP